MSYDYTPYTSEDLTGSTAFSVSDLSPFADITGGLPSGKQLIFFSLGMVCLIASIGLISAILISDPVVQSNVKKVTKIGALLA